MRFVGYGRMSSDRQNPKSAEDQIFEIRRAGEAKGWVFVGKYTDAAMSGSTIFGRTGFEVMRNAASNGEFDCIVIEDVDRLSRNIGDLAKFFEYMEFHSVVIYSLSKGGFITEMDIGFKGTMSAQFLKDLSQKTHRGLAAAVRDGRAGGGLPYGYHPTADPGVFAVDDEKAEVVRRIFQMYADGYSPREIAGTLNKDGIPSPMGGTWNASTINGHRERGVGIIRNEIYVGVRVWNRTEKRRNPENGLHHIRPKPEEGIIRVDVPELRIVDQVVWEAVQARIPKRSNNKPYPKRQGYLLSGLLKCGECGGNYIVMGPRSHVKFGCSARREKSTCSNRRMISRSIVDNCILHALAGHLLNDHYLKPAVSAAMKEIKKLQGKTERKRPKLEKRLVQIERGRRGLLELLDKGVEPRTIQDRLLALDEEERGHRAELTALPQQEIVDPEVTAEEYRELLTAVIAESGAQDGLLARKEVRTAIRALVDEVLIYPNEDPQGRDIDFVGDIEELIVPNGNGMETMVPGGCSSIPVTGTLVGSPFNKTRGIFKD